MKNKSMTRKARIPKSFVLFGEEWTVALQDDPKNGENLGKCDSSQNQIILQTRHTGEALPACKIEGTFYHELVHALLDMGSYDKLSGNEQLVQFIGGCLHQYMCTANFEKPEPETTPEPQ